MQAGIEMVVAGIQNNQLLLCMSVAEHNTVVRLVSAKANDTKSVRVDVPGQVEVIIKTYPLNMFAPVRIDIQKGNAVYSRPAFGHPELGDQIPTDLLADGGGKLY